MTAGEIEPTLDPTAATRPESDAAQAPTEMGELRQALSEAQARAQENWNQYLRAVAEFENLRKRTQREIDVAQRQALEKFAAEVLPVMDSLDLAVQNAGRVDFQSLASGQEAILQQLSQAFEKLGIRAIDPVGAPFDPTRHEAMAMQESATAEPNSVLQVIQRGYELDGRLLRPARVIVAKEPATA